MRQNRQSLLEYITECVEVDLDLARQKLGYNYAQEASVELGTLLYSCTNGSESTGDPNFHGNSIEEIEHRLEEATGKKFTFRRTRECDLTRTVSMLSDDELEELEAYSKELLDRDYQ